MSSKNLILTAAAAAVLLPGVMLPRVVSAQPLDFSQIPGLDRPPKVQIDLTPALLSFASAAAQGSDPEAARALSGVRGVRVYVYDVGQNAKPVLDFIEDTAKTLEREGWQRAVYVQDNTDKVRLYVKSADSQISGLTMMVVEKGGEAVFINVDGSLDPVMLGRLAASLGAGDVLGELGRQHGGGADLGPARAPKTSHGYAGSTRSTAPEDAPQTPAR